MRFRLPVLFATLAVVGTCAFGCNALTGVGGLTFSDPGGTTTWGGDAGSGDSGGSGSGGDGGSGAIEAGPVPPNGAKVVPSATLSLYGMTSDGYAAYADTSSNTLYAIGIESADGGAPASSTPITLGAADLGKIFVERRAIAYFAPSTEADAGGETKGSLYVWTSDSPGGGRLIASGVLAPDYATSDYTLTMSADGRWVAYYSSVDSTGSTASLYVADTQLGNPRLLVGPIDVLQDACKPRIAFSGSYLVAGYCPITDGGLPKPPDGGTSYEVATVASFPAAGGAPTTLATGVSARFAVDANGVAALMIGTNGIIAAPVPGGPVVEIDPTGVSARIADDGQSLVYVTSAHALRRASTSAPPNPIQLVPAGTFQAVHALSADGRWAVGALSATTASGTYDLYAASATTPTTGSPITLSSATTATIGSAGDSFTTDSKYALFVTGVDSSSIGTFDVYDFAGTKSATLGQGTYEELAAAGSQVFFNVNTSGGKGDLAWEDLAAGGSPMVLASAADQYFVMGPAKDKIVYTYGHGGDTDGLWVVSAPVKCPGASAITFHPPAGGPGSCTAAEIQSYDTGCITAASTTSTCSATQISSACHACLLTPAGNAQWGALIDDPSSGGIVQLNLGGCFARQGSVGCGAAHEAERECINTSCDSQADLTSFNTCETSATDTGGACACYVAARTSACAALTSSTCDDSSFSTFEQGFLNIAKVMCE